MWLLFTRAGQLEGGVIVRGKLQTSRTNSPNYKQHTELSISVNKSLEIFDATSVPYWCNYLVSNLLWNVLTLRGREDSIKQSIKFYCRQ